MGERLRRLWKLYAPEMVVTGLLILAFFISGWREPRFLDAAYLFDRSTLYTETRADDADDDPDYRRRAD